MSEWWKVFGKFLFVTSDGNSAISQLKTKSHPILCPANPNPSIPPKRLIICILIVFMCVLIVTRAIFHLLFIPLDFRDDL